jgi:hypothetical protein
MLCYVMLFYVMSCHVMLCYVVLLCYDMLCCVINWEISIYRKPTFTDSIIPYTSNHPSQHKYAAVRFLYNRLNSYGLHDRPQDGREHNPQHPTKQLLPHPKTQYPPSSHTQLHTRRATHRHPATKMDHIYLRRERNNIRHKPVPED